MTSPIPIPGWNSLGLIPPCIGGATARARAPYAVKLADVLLRYNTCPDRLEILKGLMSFRAAVHGKNLVSGFQWLDGSFLENVEALQSRPPRDIDVVTFYRLPAGETQQSVYDRSPELFSAEYCKEHYHVDAFFACLDDVPESLVANTTYWYSVWAHQRRTYTWKGFLTVDLADTDDLSASNLLALPISEVPQ